MSLPLFGNPIVHRNDPPSSAAAAAWQNASGRRMTSAGRVLLAVALWPDRTYRELAALTGIEPAEVNRRLSDLRQRGFVACGEPRVCAVGGTLASTNYELKQGGK